MVEWATSFDIPIYLHEVDRQWVMYPSERIIFWSGGLPFSIIWTLIRLGGHFAGGNGLHWQQGVDGKGALLAGDIIQVVADRQWVSFMYSYPNLIPLPAVKTSVFRTRLRPTDLNVCMEPGLNELLHTTLML